MALFDTTFAPYVPFGSRTLSVQTPSLKGTDIAVIQAVFNVMLKTMTGPGAPIGTPIPIDGTYGPKTQTAVKSIQSYFGLTADGVVGPNTYFIFGQGVGPHTSYGGPVYGSEQLEKGSTGGDVTILQNRLNCFRYATLLGGPADGNFGPKTASAVIAFKADAAANGDTGFPSNAIAGYGFYDASWIYTLAGGRAIWGPPNHPARNGFDVAFVQVLLNKLGFYSGNFSGMYSDVRSAIIAFQASEGITADGSVGPTTFYHLGLHNSVAAPSPLSISWPAPIPPGPNECAVVLTGTAASPSSFGVASVASLSSLSYLNVVGNALPAPSSFGSAFGQYAFTFTKPATGQIVVSGLMFSLSSTEPNWGGSGTGPNITLGSLVNVYPTPTGSTNPSTFGSAVLTGNMNNCK